MLHSYPSIHNIFYSHKKFGIEDIIRLQQYCLTNDSLARMISDANPDENSDICMPINPKIENIAMLEEPPENEKSDSKNENLDSDSQKLATFIKPIENSNSPKYWIPDKPDTLFWCVFISVNGFSDYYQIGHLYGKRILEEKMKIAKWIKENPKILKTSNHKFTNESIQETMSEFMVDQVLSFKGLAALALYYNRNIYVLDNKRKIYLKYLSGDTCDPIYIYYHDFMRGSHKYKIQYEETSGDNSIINEWFCLENILKPLKSISNYKVDELYVIASKIGIEVPIKSKKNELYEVLLHQCSWYKEV